MEIKKSEKANLENKKFTWILIGLVVVLAAHFVAFEWTQYEKEFTGDIVDAGDIVLEEEMIPITMPEKKTVPPPPQAVTQAEVLNIVDIEFGNAASNSLMLMAFASLGLNPRDSKYEVNQKDILENLIDVYYDENLGLVKFAVSDTGINFSTNQLYAGLMAYKASRDLNKAVNIFE